MRTVFQGKEITVTLKTSGRDLSTQEIVMGHQLATGNFEALFVNDDSENQDRSELEPEPEPLASELKIIVTANQHGLKKAKLYQWKSRVLFVASMGRCTPDGGIHSRNANIVERNSITNLRQV